MSNQFTKYTLIKALNANGQVIAIAHNKPVVSDSGQLMQDPIGRMISFFGQQVSSDSAVHDVVTEHLPLDGDYDVRCPIDQMTDKGVAYALAATMNWKSPINGAEIFYKDGELWVNNPFSITNLDQAFVEFKPQEDLAMAMAILLKFKISLRYDFRDQGATFASPDSVGRWIKEDSEILKELCRRAVGNGFAVVLDGAWDGTIPLSMVRKVELKVDGPTDETMHLAS